MKIFKETFTNTINYVQTSRPYIAVANLTQAAKNACIKTLDFVLPRNPATLRRELRIIPTFVENALGKALYNDLCPVDKISKDEALVEKVNGVFKRLVEKADRQEVPYEIRVEESGVVNAYCLFGKVVITTGILKKLAEETEYSTDSEEADQLKKLSFEDKIASVLGHEIGHSVAGHGARRLQFKAFLSCGIKVLQIAAGIFIKKNDKKENVEANKTESKVQAAQTLIDWLGKGISVIGGLKNSRDHEYEADKYGIKLMKKAGFNEYGAVWLQHKFLEIKSTASKAMEVLSTHPASENRLEENRKTIKECSCCCSH